MKTINKSAKLANVLYDVRGPIVDAAKRMEDEGQKIIKLNIGNLAPFGFDAPEDQHRYRNQYEQNSDWQKSLGYPLGSVVPQQLA